MIRRRAPLRRTGNKYGARVTYVDGRRMGSQLEADYFRHLQSLEAQGLIRDLQDHPRYELVPGMHYVADATFVVVAMGLRITADAKGAATKGGRLPSVCRVWKAMMDHPLVVVERRGRDFIETKRVLPKPLPAGWRGHATRPAREAAAC